MSGYDATTGIFSLNESKMQRYLRRPIDPAIKEVDLSRYCAQLLAQHGIQVLRHTPYGIEVVADDAQIWEILSGQPATFGSANPIATDVYAAWVATREWFNATDLGKELSPQVGAITVNKILESIGFQERSQGAWMPTAKATGFFKLRPGTQIFKSGNMEIPVWNRTVIDVLQPHVPMKRRKSAAVQQST